MWKPSIVIVWRSACQTASKRLQATKKPNQRPNPARANLTDHVLDVRLISNCEAHSSHVLANPFVQRQRQRFEHVHDRSPLVHSLLKFCPPARTEPGPERQVHYQHSSTQTYHAIALTVSSKSFQERLHTSRHRNARAEMPDERCQMPASPQEPTSTVMTGMGLGPSHLVCFETRLTDACLQWKISCGGVHRHSVALLGARSDLGRGLRRTVQAQPEP